MNQITILNKTNEKIVVQSETHKYIIDKGCQEKICAGDGGRLRIYKQNFLCRLCFGQILLRGNVKNMWIFGPIIHLDYDAIITPTAKRIEISESKKNRFLFFIYSLLLFNNNEADEYAYHDTTCKRRIKGYSMIFIIPFIIVSLLLALVSFYGIIFEFSLDSIAVLLVCAVPVAITFALTKDIIAFLNVQKKTYKKSRHNEVTILKEEGRFIKCAEKT